jgi:hypothetical protein
MTVGTRVRLAITFRTASTAALFDPSTLQLVVTNDAGSTTYTYPATVVKDSTGVYHYDVLASTVGTYRYSWQSLATGEEVKSEGFFNVTASTV